MIQSPPRAAGTREKPCEVFTGTREAIREFLALKLPSNQAKQTDYLVDALVAAGARYDRYSAEKNRNKWRNYSARRERLETISKSIQTLVSEFLELDMLSRDDISNCVDPVTMEALLGSLLSVFKATNGLAAAAQRNGKPRDLAEERWIVELADIYEIAFAEPARAWRSEDGLMSNFFRLLELSRPESFPRYGKLSRKQIDRVLSKRRPKPPTSPFELLSTEEAPATQPA